MPMHLKQHSQLKHILCLPLIAMCLSACQSIPVSLPATLTEGQPEAEASYSSFSSNSPHQAKLRLNAESACQSARRVLLGDGYNVDMPSSTLVKGRKASRSDNNRSSFIEVSVICEHDHSGSTLYTNAVVSTYDVKMSDGSTASLGLSVLGSVSVPYGRSADSLVKVADETISDPNYYRSFYSRLKQVIAERQPPRAPTTVMPTSNTETSNPEVETAPAATETMPDSTDQP